MKNIILALAVVLPMTIKADSCWEMFSKLVQGQDRTYKEFNIDEFLRQKGAYKKQLQDGLKIEGYTANTPEQFLALTEAHFELVSVNRFPWEEILTNGPNRKQKAIMKMLSKTKKHKSLAKYVPKIYSALIIPNSNFLQRHLNRFGIKGVNQIIWDRIYTTFTRQGVQSALTELGFLKTSALQRKFKNWLLTKAVAKEAILTGFGTFMGIKMFKIPTTHMPMSKMLDNMNLSDDFLRVLFVDGTDTAKYLALSAYSKKVQKEFNRIQKISKFQMVYDVLAKGYNYAWVPFYFYFMFDSYPATVEDIEFEQIPMDESFFDPQEIRINLHSAWKFDFHRENGHFPDQEKSTTHWHSLLEMSDNELEKIHDEQEALKRGPASKKKLK